MTGLPHDLNEILIHKQMKNRGTTMMFRFVMAGPFLIAFVSSESCLILCLIWYYTLLVNIATTTMHVLVYKVNV